MNKKDEQTCPVHKHKHKHQDKTLLDRVVKLSHFLLYYFVLAIMSLTSEFS